MARPDISIIVPVYNAEAYLERCIASLKRQDLPHERFEALFVDNGSTDRSAAIIAAHAPDVRLLHESKRGAYAARNAALRVAQGTTIAFTDPDCELRPDWLRTATEALARPGVLAVMGRNDSPGRSAALALLDAYRQHREMMIFSSDDPTLYYGQTNNMAVRREVIDRFGPFEPRQRGGDVILVQRLLAEAGTASVVYEPAMRATHLEITSARAHFAKTSVYAQSRRSFGQIVEVRTPSRGQLWSAYRRTVREEPLGPLRSAWLLGLLVCGAAAGAFGGLKARLGVSRIEQPSMPAVPNSEVARP